MVSEKVTRELLDLKVEPSKILNDGLIPGMEHVGVEFRAGRMFLPQVLVAARAMKTSMALLEPLLAAGSYKAKGKILIGTVKGDMHDIGKNLVSIMLRGAGYEVVDIGVGCSADRFREAFLQHRPDIIGLSALLTTTMVSMKGVIDLFAQNGLKVPIIIGGAPISAKFAQEIGAAGYARNATDAVDLVRSLMA